MPADLSGGSPEIAHHPSAGAGLWQICSSTGSKAGLPGLGVGGEPWPPFLPRFTCCGRNTCVCRHSAHCFLHRSFHNFLQKGVHEGGLRAENFPLPFYCKRHQVLKWCFLPRPSPLKIHFLGHTCFLFIPRQHSRAADSPSEGESLGLKPTSRRAKETLVHPGCVLFPLLQPNI